MTSKFINIKLLKEAKADGYIKLEIRKSGRGNDISYTFTKEDGAIRFIPIDRGFYSHAVENEDESQIETIIL